MNFILLGFNHFLRLLLFRRRESTDVEDLFIAHISGMDTLARGLRNVAKLIEVINNASTSFTGWLLLITLLESFFSFS